jgi:hypothetical protein
VVNAHSVASAGSGVICHLNVEVETVKSMNSFNRQQFPMHPGTINGNSHVRCDPWRPGPLPFPSYPSSSCVVDGESDSEWREEGTGWAVRWRRRRWWRSQGVQAVARGCGITAALSSGGLAPVAPRVEVRVQGFGGIHRWRAGGGSATSATISGRGRRGWSWPAWRKPRRSGEVARGRRATPGRRGPRGEEDDRGSHALPLSCDRSRDRGGQL